METNPKKTKAKDSRRSRFGHKFTNQNLKAAFFCPGCVLTCPNVHVCLNVHQSCETPSRSLTKTKTDSSAAKIWGTVWELWDTCRRRWSWSSWASGSTWTVRTWTHTSAGSHTFAAGKPESLCLQSEDTWTLRILWSWWGQNYWRRPQIWLESRS